MWDSPYQASRFWTESTGVPVPGLGARLVAVAAAISGMPRSQISFLDAFILGQLGVMAFRQHVTPRQHGDDIGKVGNNVEIVFDHQDRVFRGDALDQRGD